MNINYKKLQILLFNVLSLHISIEILISICSVLTFYNFWSFYGIQCFNWLLFSLIYCFVYFLFTFCEKKDVECMKDTIFASKCVILCGW